MTVYNYQTPQTNIPAAFQSLAASNSAFAQRQTEADAIARQRAQDSAAGTGALAGAALAATAVAAAAPTGGASLSLLVGAAGVGASAGSQIGRASAGGKVDQAAVLQTGLQAASVAQQAQQTSAEQDTISGIQASRAAMATRNAATPYSSVDTAGDTPPAPADPMAAQTDKILAGAKASPTPFQTANNALSLMRAAVPSSAPERVTVGGTTALVQQDATGMMHKIVEDTAGGPAAPQQVWVNKNYTNPKAEPDWQATTLSAKTDAASYIAKYGNENVLLQDPMIL